MLNLQTYVICFSDHRDRNNILFINLKYCNITIIFENFILRNNYALCRDFKVLFQFDIHLLIYINLIKFSGIVISTLDLDSSCKVCL